MTRENAQSTAAPTPDDRYIVISADGHAGGDVCTATGPTSSRAGSTSSTPGRPPTRCPYEDLIGDRGAATGTRPAGSPTSRPTARSPRCSSRTPSRRSSRRFAHRPAAGRHRRRRRRAGGPGCRPTTAGWPTSAPTPGPPRRDHPDHAARHRGLGRRGALGQGARAHRRASCCPARRPARRLRSCYEPYYEPLWQVVRGARHAGEPPHRQRRAADGPDPRTPVVFLLEVSWWAHRALTHLIVGGVFERHPDLQLVFTEQGTAWVPDELARLDYFWDRMGTAVGSQEHVWGAPVVVQDVAQARASTGPASATSAPASSAPDEVELRHSVGVDRIMWGSDYPHKEASSPFSREAIRLAFAGVPHDEVAAMLGGNAAALYGFDLEALRPLAQEIGPRVERGRPAPGARRGAPRGRPAARPSSATSSPPPPNSRPVRQETTVSTSPASPIRAAPRASPTTTRT